MLPMAAFLIVNADHLAKCQIPVVPIRDNLPLVILAIPDAGDRYLDEAVLVTSKKSRDRMFRSERPNDVS